MARRKKTSPAEDMIDLVALLPWYVGVVLAVVGCLLLHRSAIAPVAALKPGDIGGAMTGALWRGVAGVGQYFVPVICLAGAAVSAWRRRTRRNLVENATHSRTPGMLDNMSWREFEMLVGDPTNTKLCQRESKNKCSEDAHVFAPTCFARKFELKPTREGLEQLPHGGQL